MPEWIPFQTDDAHSRRERGKARELRGSAWWRSRVAEGVCHYCGKKFAPEELTMDHIIPVARGGRSIKGNVVPACGACNKSKKAMTPAEMILEELGLGDAEREEREEREGDGN
jgi:Restriction endonuclease